MAAWIGQYWPEERRLLEDEEASRRRRMVEFMLGPLIATKPAALHQQLHNEQPTTLDFLSVANSTSPPLNDNMGCTHVELEPEMPLPSGWEKCLNLKTGSIYYLNRSTGATSASDPRKQTSHNKVSYGADVSSSPSTSELTVEASNEANSNSNAKPQGLLNVNEKPISRNSDDDSELDLNLSLHVGLCPSPPKPTFPPREVAVLSLHHVSPSKLQVSANTGTSSAASSSSSTSSPISASLAFSQRILTSKQLSPPSPPSKTHFNQDSNLSTRFAMKGSFCHGDLHHSLSDYMCSMGEAGRKLVESEELSSSSTAMVTVACANCLMFVMLSRSNPRCPRCGTSCPEQMDSPQPPALKKARLGFSF